MLDTLQLSLKDSVFDPYGSERKVLVRKDGSRPRYRVHLYVDGPDLPYVASVTYQLHETFRQPTRQVARTSSNPKCRLAIWTWGLFHVTAIVTDKAGNQITLGHDMSYDQTLSSLGPQSYSVATPG